MSKETAKQYEDMYSKIYTTYKPKSSSIQLHAFDKSNKYQDKIVNEQSKAFLSICGVDCKVSEFVELLEKFFKESVPNLGLDPPVGTQL